MLIKLDLLKSPLSKIMKLPSFSLSKALFILRLYMGMTFLLHGAARLYYMSLNDFGAFLNSQGFLIGIFFAWFITLGEIIGGLLLMLGYKIRYVLIFNFLVILGGIILVHFKNGFFVVGHGQGGIEYSLLILTVIIVLYSKAGINNYQAQLGKEF